MSFQSILSFPRPLILHNNAFIIFKHIYHHHYRHRHHTIRLTWCRHSSASGPRYKVSVTHVVSVRRSGKTDTSSSKYGMMSKLALTWRSLVSRSKTGGDDRKRTVSPCCTTCHRHDQRWRRRRPQASTWLDVRHSLKTVSKVGRSILPFRHLYTSAQSLNFILSGTRNQWRIIKQLFIIGCECLRG